MRSLYDFLFKNISHHGSFLLQSYKWDGWVWDLCAGLLYEHRLAMLISDQVYEHKGVAANFSGVRLVESEEYTFVSTLLQEEVSSVLKFFSSLLELFSLQIAGRV